MPGAGGIVLANHIYRGAEADGLTLAMPGRSGFLLSNVVKDNSVTYDLAKFAYIGGAGSTNSILWLRDSGIATVAQLKAAKKEIVLGAWSARAQNAIVPKVLRQYEGWPFKVVHGYPGTNEVMLAIERREVDGLYSHQGSIQNLRPEMIANGELIPVLQTFEELPNVPTIDSLITNAKEKALLGLMNAPSRIGLPLLAPPAIPADRLEILRKSYALMVKDKEYVEEAEKRGLPEASPSAGRNCRNSSRRRFRPSLTTSCRNIWFSWTGYQGRKSRAPSAESSAVAPFYRAENTRRASRVSLSRCSSLLCRRLFQLFLFSRSSPYSTLSYPWTDTSNRLPSGSIARCSA